MNRRLWTPRSVVCRVVPILSAILCLAPAAAFAAPDGPRCVRVVGWFEERAVTIGCGSPIGLCTESQYRGDLSGDGSFTGYAIVPTADTPLTSIVFVTGDTVLTDVHVAGKRGSVAIKNAAVFHATGGGELLDVQTIVGGTEDLAGVTGVIRADGNFVDGAGRSTFDGSVCFP